MTEVRLRPVMSSDLSAIKASRTADGDPWGFFGFRAADSLERRLEANGLISDDAGTLAVVQGDDELVAQWGGTP